MMIGIVASGRRFPDRCVAVRHAVRLPAINQRQAGSPQQADRHVGNLNL